MKTQKGFELLNTLAGNYAFNWKIICAGIYAGTFSDTYLRKQMQEDEKKLVDCLSSMNLKMADVPCGMGTHIDFLKLSPEMRMPVVEVLRKKYLKIKKK